MSDAIQAREAKGTLRILHVEDDPAHAELIQRAIGGLGLPCDIRLTASRQDYLTALDETPPHLVLSDSRGLDFEGMEALHLARQRYPEVPFLFVSASFKDRDVRALQAAGATGCLLKSDLEVLARMVRDVLSQRAAATLDFKQLFEQSPDILLVLLPDAPRFTIVSATRSRLSTTHTDTGQYGRGLFEVFPDNPDDPDATGTNNLRTSLERVLATRAPDTMAVQKYDIRGEDGRFLSKYWSPKNIPVLSDSGEVAYILHRVEDVTELVRASEAGEELRGRTRAMESEVIKRSQELATVNLELREANAKLGRLDAAKTVFFSNISHEFRTPLTLMLGPLEDMLAGPPQALAGIQRRQLELVHHNALRLLKLVNALLDFSRLEAGRMRATYVNTDLAQRTRELVSIFQSAADKAGLKLSFDSGTLAEAAYVDQEMWEKIVLNLLSNAFKFTLEGGVAVRLWETDGHFRLQVQDTGIGIPQEELPHVFERFYRVQGAEGRSHEGSGIGLSLVHELVKLHGGSIGVTSVPQAGTTFTVSIPVGAAHLPAEAVREADAATMSGNAGLYADEMRHWLGTEPAGQPVTAAAAGGRVLLADDNADLRSYVRDLLDPHYQVEAVPDGDAALRSALADPPDLVLSDVMMPKLDGFGLLAGLRADPRTRDLPVILLSARAGEEASSEGLDAGADDYLVKPFSARELLVRVRTHLEHARMRRQWARELQQINRELEAFSSAVSHDLRAPLRSITGFTQILGADYGEALEGPGRRYLDYISASAERMSELIEDLLELSRVTRTSLKRETVDLTALSQEIVENLYRRDPGRSPTVTVAKGLLAEGDRSLIAIVLENLLGNAWKFTSKRPEAHINVGTIESDGEQVFFVRDDGAGFSMEHAGKLFTPFQRLHSARDFKGTGIGLATVQRIVDRHGGRIWAEAAVGEGATFFFTLAAKA